jgi:SAM-dependent methyltransferase
MAYEVPQDAIAAERLRHQYLAQLSDPETVALLNKIEMAAGWRCLEVGAGGGSVALHMAQCVGSQGEVWATDLDMRMMDASLPDPPAQLRPLKHDILSDDLPEAYFDLAHARAVMEHLPEPLEALQRMCAALKPGGWLIVEGSEFTSFDKQDMRGPFAELIAEMIKLRDADANAHKAHLNLRMLDMFQQLGLANIDTRGHMWLMRGGQPSIEWLLLALEWGLKDLVPAKLLKDALAQARREDFLAFSPLHISVWGQLPG